jgi:hypothetical protein
MGSDSFENEEGWQAGSKPHWHAGNHNLWLVEDHTTGDEVRQARSKTGASYPNPSREDSDGKQNADPEPSALRIQILEERHPDSA